MSGSISIYNPINKQVWRQENLDGPNYLLFKACCKGKPTRVILPLFMPIRTDSWKNLAKDLFFPTLVNQAIHVNNIALRCFSIILAFHLDVATLSIRLLLCMPRTIWNRLEPEEPLRQVLKALPNSRMCEGERVEVTLEYYDGAYGEQYKKMVNLIELPLSKDETVCDFIDRQIGNLVFGEF